MTESATPKRLTFKAVNKVIATRPGWTGEELVQGEGYLYFMEGNSHAWRGGSSIPVARLNHTTLEHIVADFDRFVADHAAS
jgi:hypothetical protein